MTEKSDKTRIHTASVLCCLFFVFTIFNHNIDVYFNGINYIIWTVFMLILFIVTVVFFIRSVRRSIKKRKQRILKTHLPALIYVLTFVLCTVIPGSQSFESDPVIVAGYKGTQNETIAKFRKNNTFEINSTAVFGYNQWFTGTYTKKGDTLLLAYDKIAPGGIGKTLLKNKGELITLDKTNSTHRFIPLKIIKEVK
ncbi:MAG: hypothetical protein ABIN13_02745 [Mucilaginibacter sp.]